MKKLLAIAFLSVLFLSVQAQKIKVINGDPSVLKGSSKLNIEYTYNNLMVGKLTEAEYITKKRTEADEREPGAADKWEASWNADRTENFAPKYEELMNKYLEGANMVAGAFSDAKYTMIVQTDFIEPGFNVGVARKPAYINLTINVVETENRNVILSVIEVLNSPGGDAMGFDYDSGYRIGEAYAKAGKEMAKLLTKKYL